ncbi:MAG: amino acid adenylation domain protein, partial [Firmicutes bacterium]|nr:amino acid adenylation domain protein [Bacillota bacterium]
AEEKMAKIWQEVLGVEKVGIEDNFFELGGHSLKVITLIAKVREEFCLDVIYEQIFKTPNIKEFTTCILQGDKVGIYNNYIKYNANDNNGCNLFFFPPAVPLGLIYRHLAGYLADYTLFCFNLIETEDKIRDYVKSIIAVQPQGPYILVGFSAGGTLTYEVARELEKQGYQAEIILLDCQYVEISLEVMDALMKQFDAYLTNMEISSQEKGNIAQFMQSKTADYLKYLNTLLNKEKIMANIYHIYSSNKQDMSKVNEWAQKTTGKFLKYEGFGAHESMLEPRYVEENAKIMQEILQRISIPSNC